MVKPPKRLIDEWDAKLKSAGFTDIEDRHSPRETLKTWHSRRFIHDIDRDRFEARERYFYIATQFFHSYSFGCETDKRVWFLHSEGRSLREISKDLGTISKDGVQKIIKRLQRAMRDGNTSGH